MSLRWRPRLADLYINLADKLPFLRGEGVRTLRRIKENQAENSQETFLKTRPPEGETIEYIYFRLYDIFQIENVDKLLVGLKKLFPDFDDPFFRGDYYRKFIQEATGITGGEWLSIGYVCRDRKGRFWGDKFRELKSLPSHVDYIYIGLHKVLPSVFAITYDVHLEDSATQTLNELQCSLYKSEIEFRRLIPYGKVAGGYSTTHAEHVMRQEILKWLMSLRSQVEKSLGQFIVGDFLRDKSQGSRLPSIEVYGFKGIPKTTAALHKWIYKSSRWLESLGFPTISFHSYTDGKLIYCPNWRQDKEDIRPSSRLMVVWEPYLKIINTNMYGNDQKFAIAHTTQEAFLDPILPLLVMYEMLARFQEKFEEIRRNVLGTIRPTMLHGIYFGRYIKLSDTVLQASVLFDRISKDFQFEMKYFSAHLKTFSDFTEVRHVKKKEYRKLDQELLGTVEFRIKLLKEHVDFAMTWLSQYLALRNLSVTYFLALVAGIVAVIGLLLSLGKP